MGGKRVDVSDGTKPCAKCSETKPLEAFGRSKYAASGWASYCKACVAGVARAYRATPAGKAVHRRSTENWVAGLAGEKTEGSKICPKCRVQKPFAEFPKNKRTKTGTGSYCLICSAEIVRKHRETPEGAQAHRDASKRWREANVERHADNHARWNYGVEPGTYAALLAQQTGKCAICETTPNGTRLAIDHDHSSEKVRGLLCNSCNQGLGRFKDRPELLLRAASYLAKSRGEG